MSQYSRRTRPPQNIPSESVVAYERGRPSLHAEPTTNDWFMQVTEIFRSIQGESTHAGLPCVFVRLTGCNLRCTWCDTAYAFYGGTRMSVDDVIGRIHELCDGPVPASEAQTPAAR